MSNLVVSDSAGVDLIKRTICKGATDDELTLFARVCERTGLDPFARQIYAVKRWDKAAGREVMSTQVSIDGLRLIAQRSGEYCGQTEPMWAGRDGTWTNIWTSDQPPVAARVGIHRAGFAEPMYAVAHYRSYVQTNKDGQPTQFWRKMPELMLAKVAEALALRKAFPQELSGLYTGEEMGHDDAITVEHSVHEAPTPQPAKALPPADAPSEPPKQDAAQKSAFRAMLEAFANAKEDLGDELYYVVLKKHGVSHANEFKELAVARKCHAELRIEVARAKKEREAAK